MSIWATIPNRCEKNHHLWMLNKCLESLFALEPEMAGKVIIVDDHSPIDIMPTISKYPVKLIKHKTRVSYSQMINSSIKTAHQNGATKLITINNDIEHQTKFLDRINAHFDSDSKLHVLGCLLFYPQGLVQHGGISVIDNDGPWCEDHYRGKQDWGSDRYVHAVTGAWSVIKLEPPFFYSTLFPFNYEDVDYSLSLWLKGYRTKFVTNIAHIHYESILKNKKLNPREVESAKVFKAQDYKLDLVCNAINEANGK